MSAEVCCFVPLGHVYDAVYIAEAYIQFLMQTLLFEQYKGGSCGVAGKMQQPAVQCSRLLKGNVTATLCVLGTHC